MKLSEMKPLKRNPRKITPDAMIRLQESISRDPEYMIARPIICNQSGVILGGNQRYQACKNLGLKEIPDNWVRTVDWSDEKAKRFSVVDNAPEGMSGDWDMEILKLDWSTDELEGLGFELELEDLEPAEGLTDPDDCPEVKPEATVKPGELWLLGKHRLLCGDSTKPEDVERLMDGQKAQIVFTDPPYGVSIGAKNRMLNSFQPSGRNLTDIESDDLRPEDLKPILEKAFKNTKDIAMADDCTVFVTAPQGGELGMMMMMMMKDSGLAIRHVLIWKKNRATFSMGRLDYDYAHEPILLTWGKKHKKIMGGEHRTSVWEIDNPRSSKEHPTMKPVDLYVNAYLNNSESGDNAYEPFAGSGTAFIACEQLGRSCYGMEVSPNYCDVIIKRWEDFTGKKAVRGE